MASGDSSKATRAVLAVSAVLWAAAICWFYAAQRPAPPPVDALLRIATGLAAFLFFPAVFAAIGRPLTRLVLGDRSLDPLELGLCGFGLGAALYSLVIFLLGTLGLLHSWLFLGLASIGALFAVFSDTGDALRGVRAVVRGPTALVLLSFLAAAAACALVEPGATDALRYHLTLPDVYLRQHSLAPIPNNFYSFWPMSCEMLYMLGLSTAGESAPALINLGFCMATLLFLQKMWSGAGWCGPAVLLVSMPTAAINAGYPYVDWALTFYVVAAYRCLSHLIETRGWRWAVLCGLFSSAAVATKYTGLYAVIALAAIWASRRLPGGRRAAAAFLLALPLLAGPWLLRNAAYTGNPVHPYLPSLFGTSETVRVERLDWELKNTQGNLGTVWERVVSYPAYYSFRQPFLDDTIGPSLALLLPFLVLVLARARDSLTFVALYGALWFATSPQARLLLPALAILSLACAEGFSRVEHRLVRSAVSTGLAVVFTINFLHVLFYYRITFDPGPRLIGSENRESYLARGVDGYPAVAFINAVLPPDAKLLTIGQIDSFYIDRAFAPESKCDTPLAVTLVRGCRTTDEVAVRFREQGITHILVNHSGLKRLAWVPGEYLNWATPAEKSLFDEFLANRCVAIFDQGGAQVYSIGRRILNPSAGR